MGRATPVAWLRLGTRRIPIISLDETADGTQVVVFNLHGRALRITKHPLAPPHLRSPRRTVRLDPLALRGLVDDEGEVERFWLALEGSCYWPGHRRSLIAIPGLLEAIRKLVQDPELNLVAYIKAIFGGGIWYRVPRRFLRAFLQTDVGKGSAFIDPREGCMAIHAPINPEKPLMRVAGQGALLPLWLPTPLRVWKEEIDYQLEVGVWEDPSHHLAELEVGFKEVRPELEAFFDVFRLVRWRPDHEMTHGPQDQPALPSDVV